MDDSLSCNLTFTQCRNRIVKVSLLQIKKVISILPEVRPGISEPEGIRSILAGCCLMMLNHKQHKRSCKMR